MKILLILLLCVEKYVFYPLDFSWLSKKMSNNVMKNNYRIVFCLQTFPPTYCFIKHDSVGI